MSKKETEFDRYDRMKKMERESEIESRRSSNDSENGAKTKRFANTMQKSRVKDYDDSLEEDYSYV